MKTLLSFFILLALFSMKATATDLTRAKEIVEEKCHLCHGYKGEASNVIYPRIASQNKEYIIKQLTNFKSGERQGTMNEMAANLNEEEIIALAEYFSQQEAASHKVRDKIFSAVGEYIFFNRVA